MSWIRERATLHPDRARVAYGRKPEPESRIASALAVILIAAVCVVLGFHLWAALLRTAGG